MTAAEHEASFEDDMTRLEALVKKLESGDLKLEDALTTFEEGIKLTQRCQQALATAEQKVELLVTENGVQTTVPFPEHDR